MVIWVVMVVIKAKAAGAVKVALRRDGTVAMVNKVAPIGIIGSHSLLILLPLHTFHPSPSSLQSSRT